MILFCISRACLLPSSSPSPSSAVDVLSVMCGIFIDFCFIVISSEQNIQVFFHLFGHECVFLCIHLNFFIHRHFLFLFISFFSFPTRTIVIGHLVIYSDHNERRWNMHTHNTELIDEKKPQLSDRITNDEHCFFLKPFEKKDRRKKCRKRERS